MAVFAIIALTGCREQLDQDSVFPNLPVLDSTQATYPFDKYLYESYQKPYNIAFQYKLADESTDVDYNLVPVNYDKAQIVAHAIKYLWIDAYSAQMGPDFLKSYAPRIINVIGSPAINAAQGTETLGVAEGGIKITLYNMNDIDLNDIEYLHWWKFHALFRGLPSSAKIVEIMGYRGTDLGRIKSKSEQERIARMKEIYALPQELSFEDKVAMAGMAFGGV